MRSYLVVAFLLLAVSSLAHGEVQLNDSSGICNVSLNGAITPAEVNEVRAVIQLHKCRGRTTSFALDSPGGDVYAGLKLGRYIRSLNAITVVGKNDICASTCVLVLLGGVRRLAYGAIGLHRPYAERLDTSTKEASATFTTINALISKYLLQMNIPTRLLDEMNAVSPDDIRWISDTEKVSLHITGDDPLYQDIVASSNAKRLGISKAEYYKRWNFAGHMCASLPDDGSLAQCYKEVMATGSYHPASAPNQQ